MDIRILIQTAGFLIVGVNYLFLIRYALWIDLAYYWFLYSSRAFASIVGWTRTASRDPGSLCPELVCHPWKKTQLRVLIQHWAPCGAHSCEFCMRQKSTWNSADARNAFGVPFKFSRFVDTHGGGIIEEVVPKLLPCFRKNPRRPWEWHRSFSDAWWYPVGPSMRGCFN